MNNRGLSGLNKRITIIMTFCLVTVLLFGAISPFLSNKDKDRDAIDESQSNDETLPQQQDQPPPEESDNSNHTAKYLTVSREGNIDIGVNYLSPMIGDDDNLVFEIILGTHSVDLTKYKDITKYLELRTDTGIIINEGFEWTVENSQSHHITGNLKIKNSIEGKPIVGVDTKSFRLVFKDIAGTSEREHVYDEDKLK